MSRGKAKNPMKIPKSTALNRLAIRSEGQIDDLICQDWTRERSLAVDRLLVVINASNEGARRRREGVP